MVDWPLWKAVGMGIVLYGLLASFLVVAFLLPPEISSRGTLIALSVAVVPVGVLFSVWSWRSFTYYPRLGGSLIVASVVLIVGIRSWIAILTGSWIRFVVGLLVIAFAAAWAMPAISGSLSETLWREQIAPETRLGRSVMKWALAVGLGGGGALGAGLGLSFSRAGDYGTVHLLIAILSSAIAVFLGQSLSQQLWPARPWAQGTEAEPGTERP